MLEKQNFVVTGSAGFIGARVCQQLLELGHQVSGLDNHDGLLYSSQVKKLRTRSLIENFANFSFREVDLSIDERIPELESATVVINLAAMPGLGPSWTHFDSYVKSNLTLTHRVLEALKENSEAFIVHASTSSVYGKHAIGSEQADLLPTSPYGVTKLAAENLVRAYGENFGTKWTILRLFSVFGPGQRPDMAYSKIIRSLILGQPITIYGDGHQIRTNTYIDDVVNAVVLASKVQAPNTTMNICGDQESSLLEAIDFMSKTLGVEAILRFSPAQMGDQRVTRGESKLSRQILGWSPQVGLLDGLRQQIDHAKRTTGSENLQP